MTSEVLWTLVVRILLIAAGFILSIITARFLGPEGRGIYFYWMTLAALATQFGNLGLHSSNTYLLAKGHAQLSVLAANSLVVSLIGGAGLGGLLALTLWLMGVDLLNKWLLLLPVLLMIPSGLYFLLGTNLLVAEGRIGEYNGFELTNRYLGLVAILCVTWYWRTPQAPLITMSIVAMLVCLPLYRRLRKLGGAGGASFHVMQEGFGYAMRAYAASAIAFAVLRLNALLLERFVDAATLGIWSVAAQLLDVIIVIPSTIALVLLPRIMRSDQPYKLMQSKLRAVAVILVLVCAATALLGRDFIIFVYGERFAGAYAIVLWGLPGAFALGLISIFSQYLASAGIPLALVWIWLLGLLAEVVLAVWAIPNHGSVGAMVSLSTAYILVLGMVWILAVNNHNKYRGGFNA